MTLLISSQMYLGLFAPSTAPYSKPLQEQLYLVGICFATSLSLLTEIKQVKIGMNIWIAILLGKTCLESTGMIKWVINYLCGKIVYSINQKKVPL